MLIQADEGGQILLGQDYAGRLFDVRARPGGRLEFVPVNRPPEQPALALPPAGTAPPEEGWQPPGGYLRASRWAIENSHALDDYAARIDAEGTAAEQLRAFLEEGGEPEQRA